MRRQISVLFSGTKTLGPLSPSSAHYCSVLQQTMQSSWGHPGMLSHASISLTSSGSPRTWGNFLPKSGNFLPKSHAKDEKRPMRALRAHTPVQLVWAPLHKGGLRLCREKLATWCSFSPLNTWNEWNGWSKMPVILFILSVRFGGLSKGIKKRGREKRQKDSGRKTPLTKVQGTDSNMR